MLKMKTLVAVAAALAVSVPAFADPKTTLDDVLSASGISVSGRVEAGYDISNAKGAADPAFGGFNKGDSFVFHQAGLNLSKTTASGVGGAVTLLAGEDAKTLTGSDVYLLQGYVSYATGATTLTAGRFLTLAGAEVIDSSANFNSSRGITFFLQPLYHTGVRASYKVSDVLSFTAGLLNSTGTATVDNNHQKTLELNAILTTGTLTNSFTAYLGDEVAVKGVGRSITLDYVGTLPVSPVLTLVLNSNYYNVDVGASKNTAFAVAGYANLKLDAANRVALRAEYVDGEDFGLPKSLTAFTLTAGHAITNAFEVTAEGRYDIASNNSRAYPTNKGDSQFLGSVRGVYKF